METYITTMFWVYALTMIARTIFLLANHPRVATHTLESDLLSFLIGSAFMAWVSYLKYFK